jgi:hypothetical protein
LEGVSEPDVSDHSSDASDYERQRTAMRAETIKKIGNQLREIMKPPKEMSPELAALVAQLKE